jgi:hypothetical protein
MASVSRRGILCRRADNPIEISISRRLRKAKSAESPPDRRERPQAGNWKLETGNWKLENGNWEPYFPVSIFQFLVSNFEFPISCFSHCPTNRRFVAVFFALIGVFGAPKAVRFSFLKKLTPLFAADP